MKIIDVLVKIACPVSLFAACSAMLASFFIMFFYDSFWLSHCVIFFFILLLTVLGYLVQAAYAKIFGISKNKYTALYEQTETWFVKSIGSSIIVVIASFVFGASYHPCVKYLYSQGYIGEYQFEKSTPIFFGFMAFVCLMLGIFLWHNRIERYASIQYSIAGIFVIAVSYPLTAVWRSGVSTGGFHTLMLVIFLISAGIVMTNTALADMRKGRYDLISPEVITHSVRYTFAMFVLVTAATAALVFVMFIFLNGAYMIFRMVIYTKTGK